MYFYLFVVGCMHGCQVTGTLLSPIVVGGEIDRRSYRFPGTQLHKAHTAAANKCDRVQRHMYGWPKLGGAEANYGK